MKHILPVQSSKRGVTLLIAVLLSAVVLAVGIGVYQRTYKEILFSSFWKQAQKAFGVADGALECATYFELHPTATPGCFGSDVTISGVPSTPLWNPNIPGSFIINIPTTDVCARVEITNPSLTSTTTKAYGYNTCDASNPRRVERGVEVTYGL